MFKYTLLLGFAIFTFLSSCSSPKTSKKILNKDEMTNVLIDCYMAEVFIATKFPAEDEERKKNTQFLYNEIFEKHSITPEEFQNSYAYYIIRYPEMKEIYEIVVNKLNTK